MLSSDLRVDFWEVKSYLANKLKMNVSRNALGLIKRCVSMFAWCYRFASHLFNLAFMAELITRAS